MYVSSCVNLLLVALTMYESYTVRAIIIANCMDACIVDVIIPTSLVCVLFGTAIPTLSEVYMQ